MLTREQLQRAATDTGFPIDSLEKVSMLVRLLNLMAAHPFLGPRVALKGGTALNLFVFELPRLSVDVDVNYIGSDDRETMMVERAKLDAALSQVASRVGLAVKRAPGEHAGGKWRLSYISALGRPAIIEVDINYMLRVPLWDAAPHDSREFLGDRAKRFNLLDLHELAAGKLAAWTLAAWTLAARAETSSTPVSCSRDATSTETSSASRSWSTAGSTASTGGPSRPPT